MPLLIKMPNYPKWLCSMNIPPRVIWRLSFGRNKDSDLISPKCPRGERVLASGKQPSGWPRCSKWVASFEKGIENWSIPQSIWPQLARHSPFVSLRMKAADITKWYHCITHFTSSKQSFFRMFVLLSFYEGVWVWAVVACVEEFPKVKSHLYHKPQLWLRQQ